MPLSGGGMDAFGKGVEEGAIEYERRARVRERGGHALVERRLSVALHLCNAAMMLLEGEEGRKDGSVGPGAKRVNGRTSIDRRCDCSAGIAGLWEKSTSLALVQSTSSFQAISPRR